MMDRITEGSPNAGYGSSAHRTLTAMYESRDTAETARDGLVAAGVSHDAISIRGTDTARGDTSATTNEGKGFWGELKDLFVADEDRHAYAEGMRRGNYLLSADVPDGMVDESLGVLERSSPIDMEERSESWRCEGWSQEGSAGTTGMAAGLAGGPAGAAGYDRDTMATTTMTTTTADSRDEAAVAPTGLGAARVDGDRDMVERAEERLRVGKREVGRGSVRVRSYVTETPVEEQVSLRNETVEVERRTVDRAVGAGDTVFQERAIEASERGEEAVVSKEARVVEEIGLRKDVDTRTETVRDTVRKQEVEVEDTRTSGESRLASADDEDGRIGGLRPTTERTTTVRDKTIP